MATTVITGRDLALTIDSKSYDAQATSVTLVNSPTIDTYQTLDGKAYKHIDDQWTLNVEMLADWGAANSLCEALWNAAATTPNTALPVLFTVNGVAYAFSVQPIFPDLGGTAPDALTASLAFTCVTTPALD